MAYTKDNKSTDRSQAPLDRSTLEMYQSFMTGYVKRINEETMRVTIGGVRIGSAKYTRLAQINLRTRIITFSRYAIENVPERGRRYLVLHELAHVREASHNKRFWGHVGNYEPNYRQIGKELEVAFKKNVREEGRPESQNRHQLFATSGINVIAMPRESRQSLIIAPGGPKIQEVERMLQDEQQRTNPEYVAFEAVQAEAAEEQLEDTFDCLDDEFTEEDMAALSTMTGGYDP